MNHAKSIIKPGKPGFYIRYIRPPCCEYSGMTQSVIQKKEKKMENQLREIKKELRILHLGVDVVIDIIEDGELSRSFIMHHLHEIYVRLERLINKINTMEGK